MFIASRNHFISIPNMTVKLDSDDDSELVMARENSSMSRFFLSHLHSSSQMDSCSSSSEWFFKSARSILKHTRIEDPLFVFKPIDPILFLNDPIPLMDLIVKLSILEKKVSRFLLFPKCFTLFSIFRIDSFFPTGRGRE